MTSFQIAAAMGIALCIVASGFFSGSETALLALPRERGPQLAREGRSGEKVVLLVQDLERTLAMLLVANNFVNILAASLATILAVDFLTALDSRRLGEVWGPWLATGVLTAVILVVGEITPKTIAARHPEKYAWRVAPILWVVSRGLGPIARVFSAVSRGLLRLLGVRSDRVSPATEEDIRALAVLSAEAGEIDVAEREIIEKLFELADRPVREVMTPRLEVISLEAPVDFQQIRRVVARTGHSRYPVVEAGGDLDALVGILYVKDWLRYQDPTTDEIVAPGKPIRNPLVVPESYPILSTVMVMRRNRISLAVVIDEHGGVEGVVTAKDLVSELVGGIQDEHDPAAPLAFTTGPGRWVVEGRLPIEDLAEMIHRPLPSGPYDTVAGLYLYLAGRIPRPDDTATVDGVSFRVLGMDRLRISRLAVWIETPLDDHQPPS
ncbi:MAG: hemolysin family protein [bacterium]|nr:hemolysin family protein [bacterium]MDE0600760.1 hemolysin family protein [bacterium]